MVTRYCTSKRVRSPWKPHRTYTWYGYGTYRGRHFFSTQSRVPDRRDLKYLVVDQFDAIRCDSILLVSTLGILGFLEDISFLGFGFSAKIHNDKDNITLLPT